MAKLTQFFASHAFHFGVRAVAFVSVCGFWTVVGVNAYWYSEWGHTLRSVQRPPILNGLDVRFDQSFVEIPPGLGNSKYLVLVTGDSCRFSAGQVEVWKRLFKEIRLKPAHSLIRCGAKADF